MLTNNSYSFGINKKDFGRNRNPYLRKFWNKSE